MALLSQQVARLNPRSRSPIQLANTLGRLPKLLRAPTHCDFSDSPLIESLEYLSRQHEIHIRLEKHALLNAGVPIDEPIDLQIPQASDKEHPVSLQQVLDWICHDLDLQWIVKDDIIQVTSKATADDRVLKEAYDIMPLLARGFSVDHLREALLGGTAGRCQIARV